MKRTLVLLAFFCASAALAAGEDPRPDMHGLAAEISALQKYLFTDADFGAAKNESAIKKSLKTLNDHIDHLDQGAFNDDPAMKVNLGLLRQHMKDANRAFETGSKPFARYMLQSALQMCIACHTRKKAADFGWPVPAEKDAPPMDRADYLFATRQFSKGVSEYEALVDGFPANKIGDWNLRKSLLALAVYYARVTENPSGGRDYFARIAKKDQLPVYLREELKAWSGEFAAWAKEKSSGTPSETALLKRAKEILRGDDLSLLNGSGRSFHVRRLRAANLLQLVLEAPGGRSPRKAQALLLLGQIYARVSSSLFFRFGEMYLKACITDYSKTSEARSCYVALEGLVMEGYSGSAGTNVPEEEQVELMRLKRLAY
jgi:hypothetical protein